MDNFNLIGSLLAMFLAGSLLYWATSSLVRNLRERKKWNWGRCTNCKKGRYRITNEEERYSCGGKWYRCDKCGFVEFFQYYDPAKDICW